jgi:hypothetical protein
MRFFLGLTAMLTMGYLVVAADAPSKVTFVGHDKVTPLLQGRTLVTARSFGCGSHRGKRDRSRSPREKPMSFT